MELAISFALALFISTALVPVAIRYAGAMGLVDQPDHDRKQHSDPIPRCGGLAIAVAVLLPSLFWLRDISGMTGLLLGAAIIAFFGFMDDRHELDYRWKFAGQIIGVIVFLYGNVEITKTPFLGLGDLAPWLSYPIIALFVLGVTNAVNLSDGLDGLAAGSSLLSLAFVAYLGYVAGESSFALIAVAAMGALLGFLRYNTHPATVFMGDTGSQFLGFVAACLALQVTQSDNSAVSPMLAVMIVGLPVLDTLMVMILRVRDGMSPFKPDRRHLHHQFLDVGMLHYQAVGTLYLLSFALLAVAYLVRFETDSVVLLSYLVFCAATVGTIHFFKHSHFGKRRREAISGRTERRNLWLRRFGWLHKHGATVVQVLLGLIWVMSIAFKHDYPPSMGYLGLAGLVGTLVLWRFVHGNQRVHSRFSIYGASVLALFVASYGADGMRLSWPATHFAVDMLLMGLVLMLVLAIRTTRREQFRLDTQDILVLLILLAAPLLNIGSGDGSDNIGVIIRLAVLLYAAEFLIGRAKRLYFANGLALFSFALVAALAWL